MLLYEISDLSPTKIPTGGSVPVISPDNRRFTVLYQMSSAMRKMAQLRSNSAADQPCVFTT